MTALSPGAYNGIYEMLKQRAEQAASAPPDTLGMAAKALGQAGGAYVGKTVANKMDADQEKDLLRFRVGLENELKKNEAKYKAQGEGKSFFDQKRIDDYWTQHTGDTKHSPQVGEGVYLGDADVQDLMQKGNMYVQRGKLADSVESKDPNFASYIRAYGMNPKENSEESKTIAAKLFPEINKAKEEAKTKPTKTKDNFGRDQLVYPDGTVKVLNGAPKSTPSGELAQEQSQLHPAELDTFKKGLNELDSKTLKDTKKTFNEIDKLETAVKDNNPAAFFNSKIGLVLAGGVSAGRLAQSEIVQDSGVRSFLGKAEQKLETLRTGKWTPENQKFIQQYIDALRGIEQDYVKNSLDESVSKTLSNMPDPTRIDPEFIKKEFSKTVSNYLPEDNTEAVKLLTDSGKAVTPEAIKVAKRVLAKKKVDSPKGLVESGTIKNLYNRKVLNNPDGSYSTTSSMSFNEDGKEILIPTVINGKRLSSKEAIQYYRKTGEHLGKFISPEAANKYAENLHNEQERIIENAKK